jgi:hypothetical protein
MEELKGALFDYLVKDDELLTLLAENPPWNDPDNQSKLDVVNSIIPASNGPMQKTPYITIRSGVINQNGVNLLDVFFLIRCYNSLDKTYYDIDRVMSRLKALLDKNCLTYGSNGLANVQTLYESTSQEMTDQGWNQNYREQQYKFMVI